MPHRLFIPIALALLAVLACGCITPATPGSPSGPVVSQTPSLSAPLTIHINATPPRYNLALSSTIGIRLTPVNASGIIPPDAQFTWSTTFGSFYHWGPPDFKVKELGSSYTGTAEPVYWSFFSEQNTKERPPVTVTLTVKEPSTGDILTSAGLRIGWGDPNGLTAIVEG